MLFDLFCVVVISCRIKYFHLVSKAIWSTAVISKCAILNYPWHVRMCTHTVPSRAVSNTHLVAFDLSHLCEEALSFFMFVLVWGWMWFCSLLWQFEHSMRIANMNIRQQILLPKGKSKSALWPFCYQTFCVCFVLSVVLWRQVFSLTLCLTRSGWRGRDFAGL